MTTSKPNQTSTSNHTSKSTKSETTKKAGHTMKQQSGPSVAFVTRVSQSALASNIVAQLEAIEGELHLPATLSGTMRRTLTAPCNLVSDALIEAMASTAGRHLSLIHI